MYRQIWVLWERNDLLVHGWMESRNKMLPWIHASGQRVAGRYCVLTQLAIYHSHMWEVEQPWLFRVQTDLYYPCFFWDYNPLVPINHPVGNGTILFRVSPGLVCCRLYKCIDIYRYYLIAFKGVDTYNLLPEPFVAARTIDIKVSWTFVVEVDCVGKPLRMASYGITGRVFVRMMRLTLL